MDPHRRRAPGAALLRAAAWFSVAAHLATANATAEFPEVIGSVPPAVHEQQDVEEGRIRGAPPAARRLRHIGDHIEEQLEGRDTERAAAEVKNDHHSHEESHQDHPHMCASLDDPNGHWLGSRAPGGSYTLKCGLGFEVAGKNGKRTATLKCPHNFDWESSPKCKNVDDCAKLRHGCGALGICIDHVMGYDCNCEQGLSSRRNRYGEIVCGDRDTDMAVCGGNTCGAHGICIDLRGNYSKFETGRSKHNRTMHFRMVHNQTNHSWLEEDGTYRCECTDGYYDNGETCMPSDCGALRDELGTWSGSHVFGGEYTLRCPPDSYVWGGKLREITVECPSKGHWITWHTCFSPAREAQKARMVMMRSLFAIAMAMVCVLCAAQAAGLTLGLATLEPFGLEVVMATRQEDCKTQEEREKLRRDQQHAKRILPLVRDHHFLLVTLLLFNTIANEALPIFLGEVIPPWAAVIISVTFVLFAGEIIPSAIFTGPSQMCIAGTFVPVVKLLQCVLGCLAKPIANVLDRMITEESHSGGVKYTRAELIALLHLHGRPVGGDDEASGTGSGIAVEGSTLNENGGYCPTGLTNTITDRLSGIGGGFGGNGIRALSGVFCDLGSTCHDGEEMELEELEHERKDQSHCILAGPELQLITGAFGLQNVSVGRVQYANEAHCIFCSAEDTAAEVLASGVIHQQRKRAVIVLRAGDAPAIFRPMKGASPAFDSPQKRQCTTLVTTASVVGCLRPLDLVRGRNEPLERLVEPLVLVSENQTALEALKLLLGSAVGAGVVVSGGEVLGMVTRADILSCIIRGYHGLEDTDGASPCAASFVSESSDVSSILSGRRRKSKSSWVPMIARSMSSGLSAEPRPSSSPDKLSRAISSELSMDLTQRMHMHRAHAAAYSPLRNGMVRQQTP